VCPVFLHVLFIFCYLDVVSDFPANPCSVLVVCHLIAPIRYLAFTCIQMVCAWPLVLGFSLHFHCSSRSTINRKNYGKYCTGTICIVHVIKVISTTNDYNIYKLVKLEYIVFHTVNSELYSECQIYVTVCVQLLPLILMH